MAKKRDTREVFESFLGEQTSDPQTAPERTPSGSQKADNRQTNDTLERHNIRLSSADWEALERRAATKGISTSALIRMVLREYLGT
jgi:predicted DNA binding CopG/RHH family protein